MQKQQGLWSKLLYIQCLYAGDTMVLYIKPSIWPWQGTVFYDNISRPCVLEDNTIAAMYSKQQLFAELNKNKSSAQTYLPCSLPGHISKGKCKINVTLVLLLTRSYLTGIVQDRYNCSALMHKQWGKYLSCRLTQPKGTSFISIIYLWLQHGYVITCQVFCGM